MAGMSAAVLGILGMSKPEIIGIAVAVVVLLILVIVLVVTRRSHAEPAEESAETAADAAAPSFLDEAPRDDLDRLGRREPGGEQDEVGAATGDLGNEIHPDAAPADQAIAVAAAPATDDLSGEAGPEEQPAEAAAEPAEAKEEPAAEEPAGEEPAGEEVAEPESGEAAAPESEETAEPESEETAEPVAEEVAEPPEEAAEPAAAEEPAAEEAVEPAAEEEPAAAEEPAAEEAAEPAAPAKHLVPLSDIIVTTSHKMVDLEDADVRRMLKDLVTYEIDQAAQYKQLGQNLDAVLQLTEAEKICHALGLSSHAQQIREMMKELQT